MTFLTSRRARDRSVARRLPTVMILALLAVIGLTTVQAQANTISISSYSVTPLGGGEWLWSYTIQLTSLSSLSANSTNGTDIFPDMLEIFDFNNYVPGSINWAPDGGNAAFNFIAVDSILQDHAVENTLYPSGVPASQDDAGIRNLKINYSGAGYVNNGLSNVTLGVLSAKATTGIIAQDFYLSTDTGPSGLTGTNFSGTVVPVPSPHAVSAGLALFGLLIVPKTRKLIGL